MCRQLLTEGHNQNVIAKVNLAVGQTVFSTQRIPAALPQATVKKGLRPKNPPKVCNFKKRKRGSRQARAPSLTLRVTFGKPFFADRRVPCSHHEAG